MTPLLIPHPQEKTSRYTIPSRRAARVVPWGAPEEASVYFLLCRGHIKVGITSGELRRRLTQLRGGNPFPITLVAHKRMTYAEAIDAERRAHLAMEGRHASGEWFKGTRKDALFFFNRIVLEGKT